MRRGNQNLGLLGEPITAAIMGGTTLFSSILGVGAKLWGQQSTEEQIAKQVKAAKIAQQRADAALAREAARQAEEAARQEAMAQQAAIIAEASARRNYTVLALYAVGGVAAIVGLTFVISGMRSQKKEG